MTEKLFHAIRQADIEAIRSQLAARPGFANARDKRGFTPLIFATYLDQLETARLLLEAGAEINARDMSGNTALMGVCFKGNTEIANFLIEKGADVNLQNNEGETALEYAQKEGHKEIVKILEAAQK